MIKFLIVVILFSFNIFAESDIDSGLSFVGKAYYTDGPYIVNSNLSIKTKLTTPYKVCIGYAVNSNGRKGPVACRPYDVPVYGGEIRIACPTALECINDKTVYMERAIVLD